LSRFELEVRTPEGYDLITYHEIRTYDIFIDDETLLGGVVKYSQNIGQRTSINIIANYEDTTFVDGTSLIRSGGGIGINKDISVRASASMNYSYSERSGSSPEYTSNIVNIQLSMVFD